MTWRDLMCGEPRSTHVGDVLTLAGWAARRRDHGGLVFVDLRDHTGVTQLVINPERSASAAELAKEIRNEFVLRARGEVVARSPETVNAAMPTGEVELQVDELEIVSRSTPLPFQLDEEGVDETLRLRYRWLDLRRDRMQRSMRMRTPSSRRFDRDGRPRLHRRLDAEHDARDSGGRSGLHRARAASARPVLRARAVAADLQAALHDRRASIATTRSRPAGETRICARTGSSSSGSSTSRWRSSSARTCSTCSSRSSSTRSQLSGERHRRGRFRA